MKKTTLLFTLLLLTNFGFSQKMYEAVTIDEGALKLETAKDVTVLDIVKVPSGYVVFKKEAIRGPGGWNFYIETYDENLISTGTKDVSAQFEEDDYIIEGFLQLGENYVLITTKNFTVEKKENLYYQRLNREDGSIGKPELLYSQPYQKRRGGISFELIASPDQTSMLLTIHPPFAKGEIELVNLYVFDDEVEMIWEYENFRMGKLDQDYNVEEILLGNNGQVYFLGEKKVAVPDSKNYDWVYEVTTLTDDLKESQTIDPKDFYFDGLSLVLSDDGTLYAAGYYRKERGTGVDGTCLFVLDPKDVSIVDEVWDEFSKEFITAGWSDRQKGKADKKESKGVDLGLSNLELRRVIKHEDGFVSLVGEVFWITTSTTTDANGRTTTHTTQHYGDLIMSRMTPEGVVNTRFKKHHTYYGAYKVFGLNNEVAVLYHSSRIDIMDVDLDVITRKERKALGGGALILATVNENGELLKRGIIDYKDEKYEGYRNYSRIVKDIFVMETEEEKVQVLLKTYLGSKKFALLRLAFG